MEDDPQPLVEALERNLLANEVDELFMVSWGSRGEGGDLVLGGEGDLEDGLEAKAACTFATRRSTLLIASRALRGRTLVPLSLRQPDGQRTTVGGIVH